MAMFINVRTGNTLTVNDDAVISLMEKSDNYRGVPDTPTGTDKKPSKKNE